jgi:hypothetical protein
MSQTPPPPEDDIPHGALIDEGARLVRWLITEMHVLLEGLAGQRPGAAFLRDLARHYLAPAEAALRRAIHLLANSLPAPVTSPSPKSPARSNASKSAGHRPARPRAPSFRLTEPLPRPRADYLPEALRPRISVPGLTPDPPARTAPSKPDPARLEARLLRRLAALEAAWDNPAAAARRLQRRRARQPAARPRLSFVKIPGLKARPLAGPGEHILSDLNTATFEAALNTS